MHHFTPYSALTGGVFIGVAALLYLLLTGSYAGISGIARAAAFGDPDRLVDILFIAGLVLGGGLWFWTGHPIAVTTRANPLAFILLGGLFVGFGTALGSGCTSGHGVCGLGRLSPRSLAAVLVFVSAGMLTVYVYRHVIGIT